MKKEKGNKKVSECERKEKKGKERKGKERKRKERKVKKKYNVKVTPLFLKSPLRSNNAKTSQQYSSKTTIFQYSLPVNVALCKCNISSMLAKNTRSKKKESNTDLFLTNRKREISETITHYAEFLFE